MVALDIRDTPGSAIKMCIRDRPVPGNRVCEDAERGCCTHPCVSAVYRGDILSGCLPRGI